MFRSPFFVTLFGCQQHYSYELYQGEPQILKEIEVYIALDVELDVDTVLRGCNLWSPEGISCVRAFNGPSARVEVHLDRGSGCNADGDLTVARSSDYVVTIYAECLYRVYGENFSGDELMIIVAHEFGHLLGLGHVPLDCERPERFVNPGDQLPVDASGDLICGPALMNTQPFMDFADEIGMTTVDHQAYQIRNPSADIFGSVQL